MRLISKNSQITISRNPWPHVCVDNFLSDAALHLILKHLEQHKSKFKVIESHPAKLKLSQIVTVPIYRLFTSDEFNEFLFSLTKSEFLIFEKTGIQFRLTDINSPAFPRHNDFIKERSLVCLLYLSDWDSQKNGGDLVLLDRRAHGNTKAISPIRNRLVLFYSDRTNVHRVDKVVAGKRYSLLFELVPQKKRTKDESRKRGAILP